MKVLMIAEDPARRHAVRQALEAGGCDVAEAARGELGVALAKHFGPVVIVVELPLSDIEGSSLLHLLKRDILTLDVPIIVMAAMRRERWTWAAQLMAGYLELPVTGDEVLSAVRRAAAERNPSGTTP